MTDAAEQQAPDEPLATGSAREHKTFQALILCLAEALRCFTLILTSPPTAEHAAVARTVFAALVVLKKRLRDAHLSFPLIRAGARPPARPAAPNVVPLAPLPEPNTIGDAMVATAWLLESIHQLLAMPNRLTREQRDAALELSDALTDFVPIGALGSVMDQAAE